MRQELIIPSLVQRVRDRSNLTLLLLTGGTFCLFHLYTSPRPLGALDLVLPFALLLAHLALAPVPWQWTGDEASMASTGRGFLQALVFNLAWMLPLLLVLHLAGPAPGHRGRPPEPRPMDAPPPDAGPEPGRPPGARPDPRRRWMPLAGLAGLNAGFALVFGWVFAQKEATEARERRTAGLLRASRARALQNQLDPHVLYNALNGLMELVHEDPLAAEEMIARLADLYRMLTHHGEADRVVLGREKALVEAYLSMEEMRLGDRLKVQWDWPPWADAVRLPPLLLQPLVENAIKHGIAPWDPGGDLRLAVTREGARVSLAVANTGRPLPAAAPDGVGLGNLKARLALWPEARAGFSLARQGDWTVARLDFDLEEA